MPRNYGGNAQQPLVQAAQDTLNPHRPVMVRFIVRDPENPDIAVHDRTGDHADRFFREWLDKTMWWALRNQKSVAIYPE